MDELIVARPALAVVDMQNDFVDAEAGSYALGAETMVSRIARLIDAARRAGAPVIFNQEAHRASGVDGGRLLWNGRSGWVIGKHPRRRRARSQRRLA
jgi:nicotinamidase-related amidase